MSLMNFQMTRVISSPSSSTTGPLTLILLDIPSSAFSSRPWARGPGPYEPCEAASASLKVLLGRMIAVVFSLSG